MPEEHKPEPEAKEPSKPKPEAFVQVEEQLPSPKCVVKVVRMMAERFPGHLGEEIRKSEAFKELCASS